MLECHDYCQIARGDCRFEEQCTLIGKDTQALQNTVLSNLSQTRSEKEGSHGKHIDVSHWFL